jgi:enoyl-CoA hydratase/carnithine racemase/drug/metabolite transporter (DMT)-like permease
MLSELRVRSLVPNGLRIDSDALATGAAAATGILVGATIVVTRLVVEQIGPVSLALLRYGIGFALLLPPLLMFGHLRRIAPRDVLPVCLLGVGQFGFVIALLNLGLMRIGSAQAALIYAASPLLTMAFAALLHREAFGFGKAAGVTLTVVGLFAVLGEELPVSGLASDRWRGGLMVLAGTAVGAFSSVLYRPYLREYPAVQLGGVAMIASVLFLAPFAAREGITHATPHVSMGRWWAIGFCGLSSAVGFFLFLWALQHTSPTRVAAFQALSPITATLLGAAFLSEHVSVLFLAGLGCVSVGLLMTHRASGRAPPPPGHLLTSTQGGMFMTASTAPVLGRIDSGTGTITLNRPASLNAFNLDLAKRFLEILQDFNRDDAVRVIVIRGAGKVFSAGGDVKEMLGHVQRGEDRAAYFREPLATFGEMGVALRESPKPVVAAVHGAVAGVAFNLMLACDLVIAEEGTRFSQAFVKLGLSPDGGGTWFLPRLIGHLRSCELTMLPGEIDARRAHELGLVNWLAPREGFEPLLEETATKLASAPAEAIRRTKRLLTSTHGDGLGKHVEAERLAQVENAAHRDFDEGLTAFVEKRAPDFSGLTP